ncbi:hypothetical protein DZF91_14050, partial [Actinomadura logoneensis]
MRLPRLLRTVLAGRTVRLRLTLLYGALFLVCGTALVGITYLLASRSTPGVYTFRGPDGQTNALASGSSAPGPDGSSRSAAGEGGGSGTSAPSDRA